MLIKMGLSSNGRLRKMNGGILFQPCQCWTSCNQANYLGQLGIDVDKVGTVGENVKPIKVALNRQLLKLLSGSGRLFCYDSPEYVKAMETPKSYYSVCEDYKTGRVYEKNLKNMQKSVFLDWNDTINKYVGFFRNIDDFEMINGIADAIKKINTSGYLAIVVKNQSVIARGEVSFEDLEVIHNKMETLLGKEVAYMVPSTSDHTIRLRDIKENVEN